MALPLKKTLPDPPATPGPKVVSMPIYNLDPADLDDSAEEEVDFVLRRAAESGKPSVALQQIADRVTGVVDHTVQRAAASSARGIGALRDLARQDPMRFILCAAAAAFVVGFALRLGRSSRA